MVPSVRAAAATRGFIVEPKMCIRDRGEGAHGIFGGDGPNRAAALHGGIEHAEPAAPHRLGKIENLHGEAGVRFIRAVPLHGLGIGPVSYTHLDVYKRQLNAYLPGA